MYRSMQQGLSTDKIKVINDLEVLDTVINSIIDSLTRSNNHLIKTSTASGYSSGTSCPNSNPTNSARPNCNGCPCCNPACCKTAASRYTQ